MGAVPSLRLSEPSLPFLFLHRGKAEEKKPPRWWRRSGICCAAPDDQDEAGRQWAGGWWHGVLCRSTGVLELKNGALNVDSRDGGEQHTVVSGGSRIWKRSTNTKCRLSYESRYHCTN